MAINDIPAQKDFYSPACRTLINEMIRDARQPEAVKRLLTVWRQRLGYRLVQLAEESKIILSDAALASADLHFVEPGVTAAIDNSQLSAAIAQPLLRIQQQIELALKSSQTRPQVIYLTGGSARSPLLRQAIARLLPGVPSPAATTSARSPPDWPVGRRFCYAINPLVPERLSLVCPSGGILPCVWCISALPDSAA